MGFHQSLTGIAACLLVVALGQAGAKGESPGAGSTIYDANPKHLWNRLNDALFIRTGPDGVKYGYDEIDPLIWLHSRYLLAGDSHQRALALLDEFLQGHGEKLVRDPLKRAWLQHDLWVLFDWAASQGGDVNFRREQQELELRAAEAIRRLELTPAEIDSLPDNYGRSTGNTTLADFAGGLFQPSGGWVCLQGSGGEMMAKIHAQSFGGHSAFLVMARFPGGASQAESFLARLAAFEPKWLIATNVVQYLTVSNTLGPFVTNVSATVSPKLPQFPAGTRWALVRRMCVIDSAGQIQPTRLTEGIQVRRYVAIREASQSAPREDQPQQMADFVLNRRDDGRLRAVGPDERGFQHPHFFSHGEDPFDYRGKPLTVDEFQKFRDHVLSDCFTCHSGAGIYSVPSCLGTFDSPRVLGPSPTVTGSPESEAWATSVWKRSQFDWGLLQGLWIKAN